MKKSSFVAMILGTISCIFFALGMCMTMLPQWNVFQPGVIVGCVGLIFALMTVLVWRKMEQREPIKISPKAVGTVFLEIIGALALGVGMCFVMVWGKLVPGIAVGLVGIFLLMCLIPICKGLK
ncbi:MAG: hypothetical protein QM683_08475 [Lacrimispora sp.]